MSPIGLCRRTGLRPRGRSVITADHDAEANAGARFGEKDQAGDDVMGVILAGLLLMLTRPRLVADAEALRLRSFLGGWRTVPWDLVIGVEFPSWSASLAWCSRVRRRWRSTPCSEWTDRYAFTACADSAPCSPATRPT